MISKFNKICLKKKFLEKLILNPLKRRAKILVFLFIILIVLIILFVTSKIRVEVEDFRFLSNMPKKQKTNYKLVAKLCILSKIPIIKISLTKEKIVKLKNKGIFKNATSRIL